MKGPVGVVAVSGRARQGKSFILNQLLGQSKHDAKHCFLANLHRFVQTVTYVQLCLTRRAILSTSQFSFIFTGAGFVVAPTHRPCTKGLWMWNTPVERVNADGSKYHLVGTPSELSCPTPPNQIFNLLLPRSAIQENELQIRKLSRSRLCSFSFGISQSQV